MVRRVPLSPQHVASRSPSHCTLWGPGEEEPVLGTELSSRPERRKRKVPNPAPSAALLHAVGKRACLAHWYFAVQSSFPVFPSVLSSPCPACRESCLAGSQAAAPGRENWLAARGAPPHPLPLLKKQLQNCSPCPHPLLPWSCQDTPPPGERAWSCSHVVPLQVTGRRLWKNVYDELGGSPGSTSAATCTRRHYERYGWARPWLQDTSAFTPEQGPAVVGPGVGGSVAMPWAV